MVFVLAVSRPLEDPAYMKIRWKLWCVTDVHTYMLLVSCYAAKYWEEYLVWLRSRAGIPKSS